MSRMSEMCQAMQDYCNENYGPNDIPEPDDMSPLEIAIFQLQSAHRDIEISAYNTAKFRIEIALAELRGLVGPSGERGK